jgi:two-component system, cell cycle sensor histidine kinase and response regulator CckA
MQLRIHRADSDVRVMADASQLEQVLVNLAINARDAMSDGGCLEIATGIHRLAGEAATALGLADGEYVALEVRDTGVGMDEATRARAFEPFYTTKGPLDGTGLGLSTVYGIVRQSRGAVTLQSAPGQGTTVTIHLPMAGHRDAVVDVPLTEPHGRSRARAAGRVLLVEDEPQVRMQARRLLERYGHRVLEARDGAEGLALFRAQTDAIDVIVSDVVMPGLGGVEMVGRMRDVAPQLPVVFVSGFTAQDRDLPLDTRTAFVPKPYSMASLCEAIEAVIAA